jgi:FixJ family two-component response regulator
MASSEKQTVFVVDDDEDARNSVCALVRSMGLPTRGFSSAEEFLEAYTSDAPGCLVTDVRLLGMSGIDLQEALAARGKELPVIVLTAFARTSLTVRAIQQGAVTLLDKPYHDDDLWEAIGKGLTEDAERRAKRSRREEIRARVERLSTSERDVLELVVAGQANKVIAKRLGVSLRTVENRRREVFAKMEADSVAELVRLTMENNDSDSGS